MPNWCYNKFVVEGDKEQIDELYNKMNTLPLFTPAGGRAYPRLADLYRALEAEERNAEMARGTWGSLRRVNDNAISFYTETAWGPYEDFIDLLQDCCRDSHDEDPLSVYYLYEEPGSGLFTTNDSRHVHFKETCRITTDDGDGETDAYLDDEEAFTFLSDLAGGTVEGWDDADAFVERYNNEHADSPLLITKITYDD